MIEVKLGVAMASRMAATATVTISSTSVNPPQSRRPLAGMPILESMDGIAPPQGAPDAKLANPPMSSQPPPMDGATDGTRGDGQRSAANVHHAAAMREHPPHPLDALWQAPAIIWVLLAGECLAGILALAPGMSGSRWIYFGLASLVVQWVALLTLGTLYLTRNLLTGLRPLRLAWLAVGMLLVNTWLVAWLAWWLMGDAWPVAADGWPALVARLPRIALAVGFLGLAAFQNHWRGRLHAVRAKQSELQALQARIRPHFLFNTLNTGAALVHQ